MAKEWNAKYYSDQGKMAARIDISNLLNKNKIPIKGQIRCHNCDYVFQFQIEISANTPASSELYCPECESEIFLECYWEDESHVMLEASPLTADNEKLPASIEISIEQVGDVDRETLNSQLFTSIKASQAGAVKELIERGADMAAHDDEGVSVFCNAVYYLPIETLEYVLQKGAHINESCRDGLFPLKVAAIRGDLTIINFLLSKGANINAQDDNGNSALMEASVYGHEEVVRLLMATGADPSLRSLDGKTATILAREYGHQDVVDVLEKLHEGREELETMKTNRSSGYSDRFVKSITSTNKGIFIIGGILVTLLLICAVYRNREGGQDKIAMQKQQLQHMMESYDSFKKDVAAHPSEYKATQLKEFEANIEKFIQNCDPSVQALWADHIQGRSTTQPSSGSDFTGESAPTGGNTNPESMETPPARDEQPQAKPVPAVKRQSENKYFDVVDVASWDVLNIRAHADYRSSKVGTIPPNGKCIRSLGQSAKVGKYLWIKVEYQSVTGWVNSHFLKPSVSCN
jgi:uncharacterized protein